MQKSTPNSVTGFLVVAIVEQLQPSVEPCPFLSTIASPQIESNVLHYFGL
jgi:hypothetical protein